MPDNCLESVALNLLSTKIHTDLLTAGVVSIGTKNIEEET
jgi:hypothetical protein